MKIPRGFRFGGVACGLKPARRDLALVVSDVPAAAAGVFTVNKAAAAPVSTPAGGCRPRGCGRWWPTPATPTP